MILCIALLSLILSVSYVFYSKRQFESQKKKIREDAIKASKRVNRGFHYEAFSPTLQGVYDPGDFRPMGDPIDYVVFDGADRLRNGEAEQIKEVIIMEIKTGKATLNKVQEQILEAVVQGRVAFNLYHPETNKMTSYSKEYPDGRSITPEHI